MLLDDGDCGVCWQGSGQEGRPREGTGVGGKATTESSGGKAESKVSPHFAGGLCVQIGGLGLSPRQGLGERSGSTSFLDGATGAFGEIWGSFTSFGHSPEEQHIGS